MSTSSSTAERKRKHKEIVTSDSDTDSESSDDVVVEQLQVQARDDDDDDPILSHAENRRKKKKRKLTGTSKATTTTTATVLNKRQNSVWVGNLSFKTQQDDLRTFFKGVFGEITRIHMPTKKVARAGGMKPENRGFAYVDFATPESKSAAVALSEQPLFGRKLLIKDGDDFEGRPGAITGEAGAGAGAGAITDPNLVHKTRSKHAQKILASQKQPAGPTLFFGNLPFETTEDEIWELLDAHHRQRRIKKKKKEQDNDDDDGDGDQDEERKEEEWIRKIRMGTFEDSGLCKGFAFVDFTSIDNATAALINPRNHHLNGRDLAVEYAGPDAVRRGASKDLQPSAGGGVGGVGFRRKRRPLSAGYKKTRGRKKPNEVEAAAAESGTSHRKREKDSKKRKEKKSATRRGASFEQKATILGRERSLKSPRPKPGAALAQAKRETVAIVPSQGKKIVF